MQRRVGGWSGSAALAAALTVVLTGCGSSSGSSVGPTPRATQAPSVAASTSPPTTVAPSATVTANAALPKKGVRSATCVNGWTEPASPDDDFYKQALAALQASQGAGSYNVTTVRYFAGPLAGGGIGAVYYLKVAAPFAARVVLVSGAGPGQAAAAAATTTGWKAGEWKGFRGQSAAVAYPPLPGKWSGPEYDPVTGGLLTSSVAGCLAGT